jgi:hypothetical protein
MPNETNIRKVIAMIENEACYFNMKHWNNPDDEESKYPTNVCGTPSCIGGWAESIKRFEDKIVTDEEFLPEGEICKWLGLNRDDGDDLFYPDVVDWSRITREEAIAHLEHVIATGEVNWKKFID